MAIYAPPHSEGANVVKLFPEIFNEYELIEFQLPGGRMSDFWESSLYFHSAKADQDMYKLFSSVQRLYGNEHLDPFAFMGQKKNVEQLVNVKTAKDIKKVLGALSEKYFDSYGMRKQIYGFYAQYTTDDEKKQINGKLYKPAHYKKDSDGLKLRLGLLIHLRDKAGHSAAFVPLSRRNSDQFMEIHIQDNGKDILWLSKLTFDEFYEITRKAMARFWTEEYEKYLKNGGREVIKKMVADVKAQSERLNKRAKQ